MSFMADKARRRGEIQRSIFEALLEESEGMPVGEVLARAEEILPANPSEDQDYEGKPGVRRYPKVQRFATIATVKAGWLTKDNGTWRLTAAGREAFERLPDPTAFEKEARLRYQEWRAQQPSAQFDSADDAEDAEAAQLEKSDEKRRAWLVRGANVDGVNVLRQWFDDGFCSVGWTELGDIPAGVKRADIAEAVQRGYPDASVGTRRVMVGNLHRFLNEISVDDLVVTVDGADVVVGEILGDAIYTGEPLVTRRRPVSWINADSPFVRSRLSSDAADGLRGQLTVSELTSHLDEFATLGGFEDAVDLPALDVALDAPTQALADSLLLPLDWLHDTVDLLNEKRQVVLYGPPGTGKTYLAMELCKSLVESAGGEYEVVQFHPSYSYEDFFEGLRPRLDKDSGGSIAFDLIPGPLRRMAQRAADDPRSPFVLIIDEINRANLAKVFGELYFLLEYRGTSVALQYSEEPFSLPRNLFIIGTMNTADRSIALVDAAMRRRFYFQRLFPTEQPIKGILGAWLDRKGLPNEPAVLLEALNNAIGDPDFAIGPSYLMTTRVGHEAGLERIWRTAILPLLEEHFFGEGRDINAEFGLAGLRRRTAAHPAEVPSESEEADIPPDAQLDPEA
ncbi:McrB family protein [Serinicoccus hydrothermalis]|nr:AAA family ATPase [Serinicoccus hydrothermalis]